MKYVAHFITAVALVGLLAACERTQEAAVATDDSPQPSNTETPETMQPIDHDPPQDPEGTAWRVTAIGDAATTEENYPTIFVGEADSVYGTGGCNRYRGSMTLGDEALQFGALATTMMACIDETISDQEQRFHQAMAEVRSFRRDGDDDITLLNASGEGVLTLARMEAE